ncbi:MAG: Sjogren's syndrome/scleroderma autoantigen 1 family protein [Candidatus Nitrosocaldus sp.]
MSRDSMKAATEMLRKGGTLVKEACSKCNGVQVKYSGRLICINCGNQTVLEEARDESLHDLKGVVIAKVNNIAKLLEQESDVSKQMEMARLLLYYLEILAKIGREKGREGDEDKGRGGKGEKEVGEGVARAKAKDKDKDKDKEDDEDE